MKAINALMIYEEDLKKRNFFDWLFSHVSGAYPPHRYNGKLNLLHDCLLFSGLDVKSNSQVDIRIDKNSITQVYYGYDKLFNIFQTRGLGLNWAPVRLTIVENDSDNPHYIYLITGYNWIGTFNLDFNNYLKDWLS